MRTNDLFYVITALIIFLAAVSFGSSAADCSAYSDPQSELSSSSYSDTNAYSCQGFYVNSNIDWRKVDMTRVDWTQFPPQIINRIPGNKLTASVLYDMVSHNPTYPDRLAPEQKAAIRWTGDMSQVVGTLSTSFFDAKVITNIAAQSPDLFNQMGPLQLHRVDWSQPGVETAVDNIPISLWDQTNFNNVATAISRQPPNTRLANALPDSAYLGVPIREGSTILRVSQVSSALRSGIPPNAARALEQQFYTTNAQECRSSQVAHCVDLNLGSLGPSATVTIDGRICNPPPAGTASCTSILGPGNTGNSITALPGGGFSITRPQGSGNVNIDATTIPGLQGSITLNAGGSFTIGGAGTDINGNRAYISLSDGASYTFTHEFENIPGYTRDPDPDFIITGPASLIHDSGEFPLIVLHSSCINGKCTSGNFEVADIDYVNTPGASLLEPINYEISPVTPDYRSHDLIIAFDDTPTDILYSKENTVIIDSVDPRNVYYYTSLPTTYIHVTSLAPSFNVADINLHLYRSGNPSGTYTLAANDFTDFAQVTVTTNSAQLAAATEDTEPAPGGQEPPEDSEESVSTSITALKSYGERRGPPCSTCILNSINDCRRLGRATSADIASCAWASCQSPEHSCV